MCLCMGLFSSVFVCMCVLAESVHLPREHNSQQTQRLLCSFEAPWMEKLNWEINKSGVMLSQAFFFFSFWWPKKFLIMCLFLTFGSTAFRTTKTATLVDHICHSINACRYIFAIHYFTASTSNQPLWCRPCCITFSTTATIKLLTFRRNRFQSSFPRQKSCEIFYFNHTEFTLICSISYLSIEAWQSVVLPLLPSLYKAYLL